MGTKEQEPVGTSRSAGSRFGELLRFVKKHVPHNKYDLGLSYDPYRSLADHIMRYLYARLYQAESYNIRKKVVAQYFWVSVLFLLRRLIRKLRLGKIPIRIVFLAQAPTNWIVLESLYYACLSDPLFKPYVINTGNIGHAALGDCSGYLEKHNIAYLDGIDGKIELDRLNADIFALSVPYDRRRPDQLRTENLLRYAKIVYLPYGICSADGAGKFRRKMFGLDTQRNAWRIFDRSNRTRDAFRKYAHVPHRRFVGLGTPLIDKYYSSSKADALPEAIREASHDKFKIVYAPHHSVNGWSTFLRYGAHIRRLVDETEDCYLVFRPHPLLVGTLAEKHLMSADEFRSYFAGSRCCLYEGSEYYGLFRWSDMLISDASSFLAEYAPTRNPIVYLHREDGWRGLDETLRDDIWNSCYVAQSEEDITEFVQRLKSGSDPLKGERERYQENICVGMFTGGAGKRIAAYIRSQLA